MFIKHSIVDFPNNWGEDRLIESKNIIGVIDGSTPIKKIETEGFHSQAEWLSESLKQFIENNDCDSIPKLCSNFISKTSESDLLNNFSKDNLPCAVIAAIELRKQIVLNILGDCFIAVKYKNNNIEILTDNRIKKYSQRTEEAKKIAVQNNRNIAEEIEQQMKENKKFMNKINGYWTVSYDGNFEQEFIQEFINPHEVDRILLYTDGFDRVFKITGFKIEDVIDEKISLEVAIKELRKNENENNIKEVKKHDDAAVILVKM